MLIKVGIETSSRSQLRRLHSCSYACGGLWIVSTVAEPRSKFTNTASAIGAPSPECVLAYIEVAACFGIYISQCASPPIRSPVNALCNNSFLLVTMAPPGPDMVNESVTYTSGNLQSPPDLRLLHFNDGERN